MSCRLAVACVLATCVASLGAAVPASALVWGTPTIITEPSLELVNSDMLPSPKLATGTDGTAAVTWETTDDSWNNSVQVAVRPPGGQFAAPVTLDGGMFVEPPRVAVAPDGTVIVVWVSGSLVRSVIKPPGGGFGTPVTVSWTGGIDDADIAIGPDGSATVAWAGSAGVGVATRPAGGAFSAPSTITSESGSFIDAAIGNEGTTAIAWLRKNDTKDRVYASVRRPGQAFDTPTPLSPEDQDSRFTSAGVTPAGRVIVAWEYKALGTEYRIQASTRSTGQEFTTASTLSASGRPAVDPKIAVAPNGSATVVWYRPDGLGSVYVQAATAPTSGPFATAVDASDGQDVIYDAEVVTTPNGETTALWTGVPRDTSRIYAQVATRTGGSTFDSPIIIPSSSGNVIMSQAAANADNSITAAWSFDNGYNALQIKVTDGKLPTSDHGTPGTPGTPGRAVTGPPTVQTPPVVKKSPAATVGSKPSLRGRPTLSGSARVGRTLRCRTPDVSDSKAKVTRMWLRNNKKIAGATRTTYKLTRKDRGKRIACRVTARNTKGSRTMSSLSLRVRSS